MIRELNYFCFLDAQRKDLDNFFGRRSLCSQNRVDFGFIFFFFMNRVEISLDGDLFLRKFVFSDLKQVFILGKVVDKSQM